MAGCHSLAPLLGAACLALTLCGCGGSSSASTSASSGASGGSGTTQTYSVSGEIHGLSSAGLTLGVDGATITIPSGSTTVTLASAVNSGAAYTVSVLSQPTGETCTVSNGTGTVGAADVTNVAVACTMNTYSLGGSISGLDQPGLVLVNGSDTAAVPANAGTFTMAAMVAFGSSYDVLIQAQPTGETCSLSGGSGTMPAGDVSSVRISCAANTYTVGGSISGLSSGGLVLLDNDNYTTPIAANAAQFTINGSFGAGSSYAITVESQPTGEICTVGGGSGIVTGNVATVKVGCAPVLYAFAGGSDGIQPLGNLIQGGDGNFYGTTQTGGTDNAGTVFKLTAGGKETVLHSFTDSPNDGARPQGALIQAKDGNLYGTTFNGGAGGAVFKITLAGVESVLNDFSGGSDGTDPMGLIQASDGNFYGTTFNGGAYGYGTLFKLTPTGTLTVLHAFSDSSGDGANACCIIQASDGNFYGTTDFGGTDGYGTVFRMTPTGTETVLYYFTNGSDGAYPGSLIQGRDGNLYGVTNVDSGQPLGHGTIFEITLAGTLTTLHTFNGGAGGGNPTSLIQAADGSFYGTTYIGGIHNVGTVFHLTSAGDFSVLDSFTGGDDGAGAEDLLQGSDGNLYGSTVYGGVAATPGGYGTIFEMIPP